MGRMLVLVATMLMLTGFVAPAFAQATRTWISGVGDDANPCSRTAPCKTFAGAISKTVASGEIDALDPSGFGSVTITKAITLDGGAGQAGGILVGSGGSAVTVNTVGPTDVVVLRNLVMNGAGTGSNGVNFVAGGKLIVDNVTFLSLTTDGISMAVGTTLAAGLVVRNSTFVGGMTGVHIVSGLVSASLDNVSIRGALTGIDAASGTVDVRNSVLARNSSYGALAELGGIIDITDSQLSGNGTAVQSQAGSTVRIANSDLYNNLAGFGCGIGVLASSGNNRKGGNSGSGGPVCAPNATITMQ
jgi:hypothetical protein